MSGHNKNNDKHKPVEAPFQDRRSDYDVTNTVRVSSTTSVRRAVCSIFESHYADASADALWLAFHDFERFFYGHSPEYFGVDTTYHDVQHSLDMTLAAMRLIVGYERAAPPEQQLGACRAILGVVCSLFHDFGYLRHRTRDSDVLHGAEFTRSHVTRSGRFLESFLPTIGLADFVPVVSRIVHFTGYEIRAEDIRLDDARDIRLGHLIGTADLLAQISDRCYLEKCRDRLYPEFVLGNVAVEINGDTASVRYQDAIDLLSQTLSFYESSARQRLDKTFDKAYQYVENFFPDAGNPYMQCVEKNLTFLRHLVETNSWELLRRNPPCVIPDPDGLWKVKALAHARLSELRESAARIERIGTS
jgi:hypothetical protein